MKRNKLLICKIHPYNMDKSQMHFLSERSQTLKLTYYMVLFTRHSGKVKLYGLVAASGRGWQREGAREAAG